jgi:pimeloyl-ACP methyl ester carboxylesterase
MRANNVVLVHGAFVDGSGWQPVYQLLKAQGYRVQVAQLPSLSLDADVAATRALLDLQDGPAVLVGHCYGGVVITEAGHHPKVTRLAYVAAFAPDCGESVQTLGASPLPDAPLPPLLAPARGLLRLDSEQFVAAYAADLPPERAAFLAGAQRPLGMDAFSGTVGDPAWRCKPSWYLVARDDRMIAPAEQRRMARRAGAITVESAGSHALHESQPVAVAALIDRAACG